MAKKRKARNNNRGAVAGVETFAETRIGVAVLAVAVFAGSFLMAYAAISAGRNIVSQTPAARSAASAVRPWVSCASDATRSCENSKGSGAKCCPNGSCVNSNSKCSKYSIPAWPSLFIFTEANKDYLPAAESGCCYEYDGAYSYNDITNRTNKPVACFRNLSFGSCKSAYDVNRDNNKFYAFSRGSCPADSENYCPSAQTPPSTDSCSQCNGNNCVSEACKNCPAQCQNIYCPIACRNSVECRSTDIQGGWCASFACPACNTKANPEVWFSADRTSVSPGEGTTLRWTTVAATGCRINNGANLSPSGTMETGSITSQIKYDIVCVGDKKPDAKGSVTIAINTTPIITFSASPDKVASGGSATLAWNTFNSAGVSTAQSCVANSSNWSIPGSANSGSAVISNITQAKTFSIKCCYGSNCATKDVSVGVYAYYKCVTSHNGNQTVNECVGTDETAGIHYNDLATCSNACGQVPTTGTAVAPTTDSCAPEADPNQYGCCVYSSMGRPTGSAVTTRSACGRANAWCVNYTTSRSGNFRCACVSGGSNTFTAYGKIVKAAFEDTVNFGQGGNNPITGAQVTFFNPANGESQEAVSNSAGCYAIANLAPATYSITVSHPNYLTDQKQLYISQNMSPSRFYLYPKIQPNNGSDGGKWDCRGDRPAVKPILSEKLSCLIAKLNNQITNGATFKYNFSSFGRCENGSINGGCHTKGLAADIIFGNTTYKDACKKVVNDVRACGLSMFDESNNGFVEMKSQSSCNSVSNTTHFHLTPSGVSTSAACASYR